MTNPRLVGWCAGSFLVVLGCVGVIACAPPAPVDNSAQARAGIEAVNQRFMEMVEKKDAAGVAALYTEDAKLLPEGAPPVEGRAAIQQTFEQMMQGGIARLELKTVEVEGHGDTAWEQETTALYDASGARVDEGKAIVIWKKVGEDWRLHRDIFNSNQPPPPPPAPAGDAGAAMEGAAETGATPPPG